MFVRNFVITAALPASLVLGAGCAQSPDTGDADPEALSVAQQELDPVQIHVNVAANGAALTYGHCRGDGYVIEGGAITRLGVSAGTDATGITAPGHTSCHNTDVWKQGVTYVCNSNHGTQPAGTYSGVVPEFDEWSGGSFVQHPASVTTQGLNFGHALLTLCDTPSRKDYKVAAIECCAGPASP